MDFDDASNSNEEPDELTTAAEVVAKLEEVWVNEKLAPELLSYEDELVDCLVDQIQHMEGNLQRIKKDDFRLIFHKMELSRIKFVLSSYLRTRLEKIEKFAPYLLDSDTPSMLNLMSEEEQKFAKEFLSNTQKHLRDVALNHMPLNQQELPMDALGFKPELNRSVFVRVIKDCQGFLLESSSQYIEDEIIDLLPGTQHLLEYKSISSLLKNRSVKLI